MESTARNDPCPCGSGKKYKKCCLHRGDIEERSRSRRAAVLALIAIAAGVAARFLVSPPVGVLVGGVGLALVGAYLLFTDPPSASGPGNPGAINFGR